MALLAKRFPSHEAVPDWIAVGSSLDVVPVQVPLTGIYEALRTGAADAAEGDLTPISSLALHEVQSHLALTNHLVGFGMVLANQCFMDELPRSLSRKVRRALPGAAKWGSDPMAARESTALAALEATRMTVVVPDAEAIREAARTAIDALFAPRWTVTAWDEALSQ
jgi:TRAP-type transport system periplasmic protein